MYNITDAATLLEEDRAMAKGDLHTKFRAIGPVVPEICSRTDRHTHTHTDTRVDHNTLHPYQGRVKMMLYSEGQIQITIVFKL